MRGVRASVVVVGGIVLILLTAARVSVYGSERALWAEAVRVSPEKARPHMNLARLNAAEGLTAAAIDGYTRAYALARTDETRDLAQLNLAITRAANGQLDVAVVLLRQLRVRHPNGRRLALLETTWYAPAFAGF